MHWLIFYLYLVFGEKWREIVEKITWSFGRENAVLAIPFYCTIDRMGDIILFATDYSLPASTILFQNAKHS